MSMLHFPSMLPSVGPNGLPRRTDSLNLNATQQRSSSHPLFLKVEEELHDARRVHSDGQEDDLRSALSMVINRVTELSFLLNEAYKSQADLEVQLNVAKSNLQLVISNNEMLEDALKKDNSSQSKDVGWRRSSGRDGDPRKPRSSLERSQSVEYSSSDHSPPPSARTPPTQSDNRFFKFRFNTAGYANSRPATPPAGVLQPHHLTSPSMPSLTSARSKEVEDLTIELEKERAARKSIVQQKIALEEELESLSQALFEEANKMVATERKKRAETEEELNELKLEKEALRKALKVIDSENSQLREISSPQPSFTQVDVEGTLTSSVASSVSHSRSSSIVGIKSRPASLELASLYPLPPSPAPGSPNNHMSFSDDELSVVSPEEDSQPTPRFPLSHMPLPKTAQDDMFTEPSPWADIPSSRKGTPLPSAPASKTMFASVA